MVSHLEHDIGGGAAKHRQRQRRYNQAVVS
jgi:hypothetical protein